MQVELFPKICKAVTAMAECCTDNGTPIARSEVYNETWLLRMVLSCIHDCSASNGCKKEIRDALSHIKKAVCVRWISEGGLEPAFKNEGTTWTDAILGNVRLRGESVADSENMEITSNKRKVELADSSGDNPGVVIVEAKMGSPLDQSVKNSPNYDQAARNIACLAKLLLKADKDTAAAYLENSAVVVFMPDPKKCLKLLPELDDDQENRMRKALNKRMNAAWNFFNSAQETIESQEKERTYDIDEEKTGVKLEEIIIRFKNNVKKVAENSKILTWDEIIDAIADENENKKTLKNFYIHALKEIVPKKRRHHK